jgi:hypothetical protein
MTFNELHGIISQKMVPFITTAVGTSNPRYFYLPYKITAQNQALSHLREPYPRRGRIHLLVAWCFHVSQGVGISKEMRNGVYIQYYTGGAGDWEKRKLTGWNNLTVE